MGIKGNEFADKIAKSAALDPCIMHLNLNIDDLNKYFKKIISYKSLLTSYDKSSLWYQKLNIRNDPLIFQNSFIQKSHILQRRDIIKIMRIRLGHTRLTHEHILSQLPHPRCSFCNDGSDLSLDHILENCHYFTDDKLKIFKRNSIIKELKSPTIDSMNKIILFLKVTGLYSLI